MSRKRKIAQEPMLYIAQPELKSATASMQSHYRTPVKKSGKTKAPEPESSIKEKELRKRQVDNKKESRITEKGQEEAVEGKKTEKEKQEKKKDVQEQKPSDKNHDDTNKGKRQRFREMTIEDKVEYFVGLPKQVPRMKCEVRTTVETYRGLIVDYKEGVVHMKTIKRPYDREVNIKDIQNIRLLGF